MTAQRLTVHDERDLGDLRVVGTTMLLARQLDYGVRSIIQKALQAVHLPLGVLTDGFRDVNVLALDDRPHS
jgi:hypothetical protein